MTSRDINDCNPILKKAYLKAEAEFNSKNTTKVFLTATHRSNEEQERLYAQGRTTAGKIVTNARAGQSKHNRKPSDAFDIAFRKPSGRLDWSNRNFITFNQIISRIEPRIKWGGNFKSIKDLPHFEI